jgi:hypothetical protein
MSETSIVPGQWFYETVGKTWFIVHDVKSNRNRTLVHLKEPDTGSNNYLLYQRGQWLPAKQNDDGVFYVVKCRYGNFEFRGDEGPSDAQLRFCSYYVYKHGERLLHAFLTN